MAPKLRTPSLQAGEHVRASEPSFWTDAKVALLRELVKQPGLSAGDIGERLGGITRSAVLGKIHRMKLPWARRDDGSSAKRTLLYGGSRAKTSAKAKKNPKAAATAPLPFNGLPAKPTKAAISPDGWSPPLEALPAELKTLDDWDTSKQCMAPYLENPVRFGCTGERVPGLSYCHAHAARFLSLPDPRTERKLTHAVKLARKREDA